MTVLEMLKRDANVAMDRCGMYYSGDYLQGMADLLEGEFSETYDRIEKLRDLVCLLYVFAWMKQPCLTETTFGESLRELGIEAGEVG